LAQRIIFINRFFFPDHSATSQILSDLAFALAASGKEIHVIASRHLYRDSDRTLPKRELVNGVHIRRVGGSFMRGDSSFTRLVHYLAFYAATCRCLLIALRRGDIVVTKTDPPLLSLLVTPLAGFKAAKAVNWLQDLYPEVAAALGMSVLRGRIGRILATLRDRSLAGAQATVVIGDDMAHSLIRRGLAERNIHVIHNWSDDKTITGTSPADEGSLRHEWNLEGKFVIGYSGNLGRAHEFTTVLDAAEHLKNHHDICFLFVGAGHGVRDIVRQAHARRLSNVIIHPYQPRDRLGLSLALPDVHWLSLRPELNGFVLPSKFYGIAAAGRPLVVIAPSEAEFCRLVVSWDCGIAVTPGDCAGLTQALLMLKEHPSRRRVMGMNARRMLDRQFSKARALEKWKNLIDALERAKGGEETG
jgi:glycosyltransferase involved in cell wall biosynthesis